MVALKVQLLHELVEVGYILALPVTKESCTKWFRCDLNAVGKE